MLFGGIHTFHEIIQLVFLSGPFILATVNVVYWGVELFDTRIVALNPEYKHKYPTWTVVENAGKYSPGSQQFFMQNGFLPAAIRKDMVGKLSGRRRRAGRIIRKWRCHVHIRMPQMVPWNDHWKQFAKPVITAFPGVCFRSRNEPCCYRCLLLVLESRGSPDFSMGFQRYT